MNSNSLFNDMKYFSQFSFFLFVNVILILCLYNGNYYPNPVLQCFLDNDNDNDNDNSLLNINVVIK